MNTKIERRVNIAPSSTDGHYVENAKNVIDLDNVTETFIVEGASVLTTSKHTTLEIAEDCLINCQMEFNPFSKMFEKSKD